MRLFVIVSCMGRLSHLKLTAPTVVESGRAGYCLVDYSCPDGSGAWLGATYPRELESGSVCVVDCPGERRFHKTRALNLGARRAVDLGAELLCFADADTLFRPNGLQTIARLAAPGNFSIARPTSNGRSVRSLTGFLVVAASDFERCGGYDEEFVGWGSEDVAMRLKLHLVAGLEPVELPASVVLGIPHSDRMRVRFADDSDLVRSAERNEALLRRFVRRWTGSGMAELPKPAQKLLFRP